MEVGNMLNRLAFLSIIILLFGFIFGCGEKLTKEQIFAKAEKYEQEKKFSYAIKTYQKIIKKFGDTEQAEHAKYRIALIYSNNLQEFDKSIATHEELIKNYPLSKYSAESLYMIASIYEKNLNNPDKAKDYLNQYKEQLFVLGEKFELDAKFEDAVTAYQKLTEKFGDSEKADFAQYKMALIYSNNLSNFNESIVSHKKLIEKYPSSKYAVQSLFMIGFIYANNLNDLDKAREYYKKFLKKYPENELVNSVKWELDHLGQDINEMEFLAQPESKNQAKKTVN